MEASRWKELMARLGLPKSMGTYERLVRAYAEPHRHYHTTEHICACLRQLDGVRDRVGCPDDVELALWFHDAIYDTASSQNELESARWAQRFLLQAGADASWAERIRSHIMATCHASEPETQDAAWVVDIDLSILGRDEPAYDRFEKAIRAEYVWVPLALYRRKRAEILASFLARRFIYFTEPFKETLEAPARRNLTRAIAALTS